LSKPTSERDTSSVYNWRTDVQVAAGYFDDLASHGLDLFVHFWKDMQANGISVNQQGLYSAKDAIVGCWRTKTHKYRQLSSRYA
jgi:hypothetical protein